MYSHHHGRPSVSVVAVSSLPLVPLSFDVPLKMLLPPLSKDAISLSSFSLMSRACNLEEVAVALPADHRLAGARSIRLKQLDDEPFVMFRREISPVYFDSIISSCQKLGLSPRILHFVRNISSQMALVGFGQGLALVPSRSRDLAPPGVVVRRVAEKIELITTAAAWSRTAKNPVLPLVISTWGW